MSTQALLDKIKASSADAISQIEAEAAATVTAINEAAAAEVAVIEQAAIAAADKSATQVQRATLAKARQSGKLVVQTARREAFDAIMAAAHTAVVAGDASKAQQWSDQKADLEMHLSKQIA